MALIFSLSRPSIPALWSFNCIRETTSASGGLTVSGFVISGPRDSGFAAILDLHVASDLVVFDDFVLYVDKLGLCLETGSGIKLIIFVKYVHV